MYWFGCAWSWITNHATVLATVVTAFAGVAVAVFTRKLTGATHRQLDELARAAQLARQEFLATHRPHIKVHSFEYSSEGADKIGATFRYVNTGANKAIIDGIAGQITEVFEAPGQAASVGPLRPVNKELAGGEEAMFTISSKLIHAQMVIDDEQKRRSKPYLFAVCIGYVAYRDEFGVSRKTGFCRRYEPGTRSWLKINNSDYEYAY